MGEEEVTGLPSPSLPPHPLLLMLTISFSGMRSFCSLGEGGGTGDNERSEISAPDYVLFSLSSLKKKKKKRRSIDRSLSSSSPQ